MDEHREEQTDAEVVESAVPRARAIRAMREWIEQGKLAVGETLPSERALAVRLGVGRATIRRALQVLEAEGWIVDRGGHVRIVAAGSSGGDGLMRQVVAVVGADPVIQAGVMEGLGAAGAHALALNAGRLDEEQVRQLVGMKPGGIVLAGEGEITGKVIEAAGRSGVAVIACGDGADVDRVVVDEEAGAYELTRWVIAQGKRRPLMVWNGPDAAWRLSARQKGYERALAEAPLEPLHPVQVARVQVDAAAKAEAEARLVAGYLMEQLNGANPADAIIAGSDDDVPAILAACRMLGKDVMVVSSCQLPVASCQKEAAASVDPRLHELGRELAKLMLERMAGQLPAEAQRRVVLPRLVVREENKSESKPVEAEKAAEVPLTAAPQIGAVAAKEEEKGKPLFGWKMEGGRWTLGGKK